MTTASIFVSSVQKELTEERRAVKAFIEGDPLLGLRGPRKLPRKSQRKSAWPESWSGR